MHSEHRCMRDSTRRAAPHAHAQIGGPCTVRTDLSDPLGAGGNESKAGQYAIFGGLFFGTAGRWRLVATVPQLPGYEARSSAVTVVAGAPVAIRFGKRDAIVGSSHSIVGDSGQPGPGSERGDGVGSALPHSSNCAALRSRSARVQRATPARSAAYGDANRANFGPSCPVFVKRIEPSSVGANGQKTRLFEFSILVPVPPRPALPRRL